MSTDAELLCGIDWVTAHADEIDVANMSLQHYGEEGLADHLQAAIRASVTAGVTHVAAAGNDGGAVSIPGRFDEVITVSACYTEPTGDIGFPVFSNYGPEVDLAARGVNVFSTWKNGRYNTLHGTSMACAHVSAAAALYLRTHPGARPTAVREALVAAGENAYLGQNDIDPEPLVDVRGF